MTLIKGGRPVAGTDVLQIMTLVAEQGESGDARSRRARTPRPCWTPSSRCLPAGLATRNQKSA